MSKRVIMPSSFSWNWQRIIPGKTNLFIISNQTRTFSTKISFTLPNATLYASLVNLPKDIFSFNSTITMEYKINPQNIKEYIKNNPLLDIYAIHLSIQRKLEARLFDTLYKTVLSISTKDNIQSQSIASTIAQNIPILLTNLNIQVSTFPNKAIYKLSKSEAEGTISNISTTTLASPSSQSKKQALSYYIYLITQLSTLIEKSPSVIDIIKTIPPQDIISELLQE